MATPIFQTQFRQYFTSAGDGTGAINYNGDYSASALDIYIQPPANKILLIGAVFIAVSDNAAIGQTDYGAIPGGVSVGVAGFIKQNGVEVDAFAGNKFKQNVDWYGVGSEVLISSFAGGAQTLSIKFNTFSDTGGFVKLDGRTGDRIGLRLNDNFSLLVKQVAVGRGLVLTEPWDILKN